MKPSTSERAEKPRGKTKNPVSNDRIFLIISKETVIENRIKLKTKPDANELKVPNKKFKSSVN